MSVIRTRLAATSRIWARRPCSRPAFTRCTVTAPQPNQTIAVEPDVAVIHLPPKATHSLICFSLNTNIVVNFRNDTAEQDQASYRAISDLIIENELLNQVIDPNTGE